MKEETVLEGLPYLIVGHTSPPKPRLSILLTGEGIKAIADKVNDSDRVRITIWKDSTERCTKENYYQEITILEDYRRAE